ncbi:heterokaryon incompatibility protein-domain-containing protein [Xylaria curta]|nr:heterokaryon incompatibility protein-domain-containing protein [Xylaria curta]
MRLLNVQTLQIEPFLNERVRPRYAILSHTWRDGEEKIQGCCNIVAQSDNLEWAWVDTCCIDKRSSAELSEAIDSMFKWYQNAAQCYPFLQDVTGSVNDPSFQDSRWCTREQTLQELIAPKRLSFINNPFFKVAPLQTPVLPKKKNATRHTTRPEDVACSLLGMFDANMPLLYGKGRRAFIREEIISQKLDNSILAWGTPVPSYKDLPLGALDTLPEKFKDCGDFEIELDVFDGYGNLDF